jgi:hypothetical protein
MPPTDLPLGTILENPPCETHFHGISILHSLSLFHKEKILRDGSLKRPLCGIRLTQCNLKAFSIDEEIVLGSKIT